jgi:hypothetical protein
MARAEEAQEGRVIGVLELALGDEGGAMRVVGKPRRSRISWRMLSLPRTTAMTALDAANATGVGPVLALLSSIAATPYRLKKGPLIWPDFREEPPRTRDRAIEGFVELLVVSVKAQVWFW